jgi:hypothetical protein
MVMRQHGSVDVSLSSRRGTTNGKILMLLIARGNYVSDWVFWKLIQDRGCRPSPLSPAKFERIKDPRVKFTIPKVGNDQWLDLFRFFPAVGNLYLSERLAMSVAPALRELVGGGVTEVLPALQNLFIENFQSSGLIKEAIGEFVAARELYGHPVTAQSWTEEIGE